MLGRLFTGFLVLVGLAALVTVGGYFALKRPDIAYETLASRYESAASRYVDLPGGVRVHYRDEGVQAPGAPTLLLIHGFAASLHTWEKWIPLLGDEYRVVSLDLPGHGLTRAPAGYQASMEAYRDIVAEFAQAQGLRRFAVAGNSMGGNVAWEFALAHPEQVDALILIDSSGWPETRPDLSEEPQIFKLLRNPIAAPILRDLDNTRLTRQGLLAAFPNHPDMVDDAMVSRYVDLARAPGHRDILLQLTLGFRSRNYATSERLAALATPVLILHGDQDRLVRPEHGQLFKDAIARSELVMFENVGPVPQEEIPDQSAMALREFLYRIHEGSALPVAAP